VVSVGRGKRLVSGGIAEPIVKAGDSVIFDKHRGVPVSVDGAELLMVFEDDILAVVV
jgi:chaperonin GroES